MNEQTLDVTRLLEMGTKMVSESERKDIKEKYGNSETGLSGTMHSIITGLAIRLARAVIDKGGSEHDVKKALTNLMVCIDAKKYKLDWRKWQSDNDIDLLTKLFVNESILSL